MPIRIMVSRHSAFYSPLICSITAGFLEEEGLRATYSILRKGQRSHALIRDGLVDIMTLETGARSGRLVDTLPILL